MTPDQLKQSVVALVRADQKIEAIKLYRSLTGQGLANSKRDVEALAAGTSQHVAPIISEADAGSAPSPVQFAAGGSAGGAPQTVESLVRAGQKIEAIRYYRLQTGASLRDAKAAIDAMEAGAPVPTPQRTPGPALGSAAQPTFASPRSPASPRPPAAAPAVADPARRSFSSDEPTQSSVGPSGGAFALVVIGFVVAGAALFYVLSGS